ncbi:hypothetical protein HUJ04_006026 [Dendroctonus ponderosae]|nr:hypothetical protein HUJ04_006026 [Dendroctonus ponderosae]
MANKASPKKMVKNIEKPRLVRQTCKIFKHFEPAVDLSACRVNLQAVIPLVNVENEEESPVAVPPRRFRTKPPRNIPVFKSSSSSSLESKALKQEILENRKPTIAQTGQGANSPRLAALKSEIHQSRTDNVFHNKVLITELRSEIAQYKQFSKYQVYSNYEGNVAEKKEHSEPLDNSARDWQIEACSDRG